MRRPHLLALIWLPCVLVAAMWMRSYWVHDRAVVTYDHRPGLPPMAAAAQGNRRHWWADAGSLNGRVILRLELDTAVTFGTGRTATPIRDDPALADVRFEQRLNHHVAGFGYGSDIMPFPFAGWAEPAVTRSVVFPHWFLVATFAAIPAARALRRRRPVPGLCPTCRYDLRATPRRCPECGSPTGGS